MKRLGIFGGSFSPIHEGHFKSALAFYDSCRLDELLIMPTYTPPHKELQGDATPEERLQMARLTFSPDRLGGRTITVCDWEIRQEEPSYTYKTLQHFASEDRELFLLVGSDMFLSLPQWKNPDVICALATIVLQRREDRIPVKEFRRAIAKLENDFHAKVFWPAHFHPVLCSSTTVRNKLAEGGDVRMLLESKTAAYICENGLYGSGRAQLRQIANTIAGELSASRLKHVLSVGKTCERMARLYGLSHADTLGLCKAALLHDLTHEKTLPQQQQIAARHGIELTKEDLASPAVLHQFTGAAEARARFALRPEDAAAIACHTTGKAGMNLEEMLLCLADYIEETRPYPECIALREAFFRNFTQENKDRLLRECMMRYLTNTTAHLQENGRAIHPLTAQSLADFKKSLVNYRIL